MGDTEGDGFSDAGSGVRGGLISSLSGGVCEESSGNVDVVDAPVGV